MKIPGEKGRLSSVTEAHKFEEELGDGSILKHPNPSRKSHKKQEEVIEGTKIRGHLKKPAMDKLQESIKAEKWHGHLLSARGAVSRRMPCLAKRVDVCTYPHHCWCNEALRAANTDYGV